MNLSPHRILEVPHIYRLAQYMLAPGFRAPFLEKLRSVAATLPVGYSILDVACGPKSWTWELGMNPIGLDYLPAYTLAFASATECPGARAVTASATDLPFRDASFDGVWCFSLLHHLSDEGARTAIREMVRVCRPSGYVVIWEIVLPERPARRPIAWVIRHLDRGGKVRTRQGFQALFGDYGRWQFHYFRYTLYGLEGFFSVHIRQPND